MSPGFPHPPLPVNFTWLAHCVHLLPASKLSLQSLFRLWLNYLHIFERNLSGDRRPQPLPITTFLPPLLPPLCLISAAAPITLSRLSFFCFAHAQASPNWQSPHLLFPPPQILCPWTQSFWWMKEWLHERMNLLLTLLSFGTLIFLLTFWTWLSFSNLLVKSSFLWLPSEPRSYLLPLVSLFFFEYGARAVSGSSCGCPGGQSFPWFPPAPLTFSRRDLYASSVNTASNRYVSELSLPSKKISILSPF